MKISLLTEQNRSAFAGYIPDTLQRRLDDPDIVAIGVAEAETDIAAGVLIAHVVEEVVEIIHLFVSKPFRERGYARELLTQLRLQAYSCGMAAVQADFTAEPSSTPLRNLFRSSGFVVEEAVAPVYRLTVQSLKQNRLFSAGESGASVLSLRDIPAHTLDTFEQELAALDTGVPLSLPVDWPAYHPDMSVGYIKNRTLCGLLLVSQDNDGLTLEFVYAMPGEKTALAAMLRSVGGKALTVCPPDTEVAIAAINPLSVSLTEALVPDAQPLNVYRAVYTLGA